ncbi:hypothetical protein FLK61_26355 [Paenalkalicoccus suaedae]|uniref:Tubby C-terminal domain-containing protein n=1 Tax=Paenalkalicoccus suaedae TaxID=2592382 RepID=A0A859FDI5_9BACI|nr:hypothetical protein [Paenalkalicoccus suaedae]QKS70286.1 hypothetical protein FLK61_26355 [Paenalkalicoccus suaedae]
MEIDVLNADGKVVYSLEKYYKNIWQKLLALHFTTWFINISIKNTSGFSLAKAEDIGVVKRKWSLIDSTYAEGILLTDTSKFKMTERLLEFKSNGHTYIISKKANTTQTMLYEDSELIVKMEESGKLPPRKNYITFVQESRLPEPAVICILHLFEIGI